MFVLQTIHNMNKDKKNVGQPILSQVFSCIPSSIIESCTKRFHSNKYHKKMPVRVHLVSLLYGFSAIAMALERFAKGCWAAKASSFI